MREYIHRAILVATSVKIKSYQQSSTIAMAKDKKSCTLNQKVICPSAFIAAILGKFVRLQKSHMLKTPCVHASPKFSTKNNPSFCYINKYRWMQYTFVMFMLSRFFNSYMKISIVANLVITNHPPLVVYGCRSRFEPASISEVLRYAITMSVSLGIAGCLVCWRISV